MRVLVCGGRDYSNAALLFWSLDRLHELHKFTHMIHGAARGRTVSPAGGARENHLEVLCYPAEWDTYGKGAGPIRNLRMIVQGRPDLVAAFKGGAGTANMKQQAREHGIRIIEI